MTRDFALPRLFLIYLISIPLALFIGYLMATPLNTGSMGIVSMCLLGLAVPLLIKSHHAMLVAMFNTTFIVYALPGTPGVWVLISLVAVGFAVVNRTLKKQSQFIQVPAVTWALVFLTVVVVVTAMGTGGIGARVFGSETYGGGRYFGTFAAILGYFALVTQPIPKEKGVLLASLFFLGGTSAAASDIIYAAGESFYFLFILFPPEMARMQAVSESVGSLTRTTGLAWGALAIFYFILLRFGIRGLLDLRRPWRLVLFVAAIVSCFFGGYRSSVLVMVLVFTFQFFFEGLHRTRFLPIILVVSLLAGPIFLANIERLPLTVQRSFSFLPVKVHPMARADAVSTVDWRVAMWRIMLPEVSKYVWFGKGYSFSGAEFYLANEAIRTGVFREYEGALVSGEYHHGLLTLIVPFGIWGLIAFLWLAVASLWVVWRNWRYGDPILAKVNTFLIAYLVARYVVYVTIYGQFEKELVVFTGTVGLSIALNAGVRRPEDLTPGEEGAAPQPTFPSVIPLRAPR